MNNDLLKDSNEPLVGGADVRDIILSPSPVKGSGIDRLSGRKLSISKTTQQLNDLYR
jgi:hypothetical protein